MRRAFGIAYDFVGAGNDSTEDSSPSTLAAGSVSHALSPDLVFGSPRSKDLEPLSLSLTQIIMIEAAYRTHVDPVVKVFHSTSAWDCIGHDGHPGWEAENMDLTRASDQCLFRAICFVTAVATDGKGMDAPLGFHGQALIEKFRIDAEVALSRAKFMKTRDFRVLQALTLYLIALQSLGDDETVWMVLGIVIRIASVLGLPHDVSEEAASRSAHSSYRLEMMRRLWWAIVALDARVTRILGRTGYLSHNFNLIPRQANVDDNRLSPSMIDIAEDSTGLTDVVYVRYRATLSDVLPFIYASGNSKEKSSGILEMIADAEHRIEDQFMQHCDKSVPIQLLTLIAGRGYIKRVKLAMYSIYPDAEDATTQVPYASEAFWLAKDSMDLFILLWTDPSLKQWQWHWRDFFGWHTLRMLVREIAKRSSCSKVIDAWKLVKKAASLAVTALRLGEEKARLVGDLRMLIEAADVQAVTSLDSYSPGTGAMVRSIMPGMGSNPHNALFPGMGSSLAVSRNTDGNADAVEFDLKKVNWTEIDRILLQLGTYIGG